MVNSLGIHMRWLLTGVAMIVVLAALIVFSGLERLPSASREGWRFSRDAEALGVEFIADSGVETRELSEHQRDLLEEGFLARSREIKAELAALEGHDLWGEYSTSSFDAPRIQIAPESGFAYSTPGLGGYGVNFGSVDRVENRTIYLDLALDPAYNDSMSTTMCVIDWGRLRFLVPSTQVIPFCNDINHGSFPYGFLRNEQWAGPYLYPRRPLPHYAPELPARYQPFLLERQIRAKVLTIEEPELIGSYPMGQDKYLVVGEIDAGRSSGLLPGMSLKPLGGREELEVFQLQDGRATVRMFSSEPWNFPPVGSIVAAGPVE